MIWWEVVFMPNNNDDRMLRPADEARALRKDVLTVVLILSTITMVILLVVRSNEINQLKDDIQNKKEQKTAIVNHNKKVDKLEEAQLEKINLNDVKQEATKFNDLFFDWDTWAKYDGNMKKLQKNYPHIDDSDVVDISGEVVGHGRSPISTYDATYLTTANDKEITQFVEQEKEGVSDESSALWYIISDYKDGEYDIKYMKRYKEYTVT